MSSLTACNISTNDVLVRVVAIAVCFAPCDVSTNDVVVSGSGSCIVLQHIMYGLVLQRAMYQLLLDSTSDIEHRKTEKNYVNAEKTNRAL